MCRIIFKTLDWVTFTVHKNRQATWKKQTFRLDSKQSYDLREKSSLEHYLQDEPQHVHLYGMFSACMNYDVTLKPHGSHRLTMMLNVL